MTMIQMDYDAYVNQCEDMKLKGRQEMLNIVNKILKEHEMMLVAHTFELHNTKNTRSDFHDGSLATIDYIKDKLKETRRLNDN